MLQQYGVGGISDMIHDVINDMRHHSRQQCHLPSCAFRARHQSRVFGGAQKIFFGGTHFVNSMDRRFIKNNNYSTIRLLEALPLDLSCCFIEEH